MKSKSKTFLEDLELALEPLSSEIIKQAFQNMLARFNMDKSVYVDEVEVGSEGDISVNFLDSEGDSYELLFTYDEDDGAQAFAIDDSEDDDNDEDLTIAADIGQLNPAIVQTQLGSYVNLGDLSWLDKDTFIDMLLMLDFPLELEDEYKPKQDEFGNFLKTESITEIFRNIVKAGKRVRVSLVRRRRKKILTPAQRAGIRKAKIKRRRSMGKALRKRRKSLLVRKRLHLKAGHLPRGFKIRR
jgi:hypothetical protein